MGVTWHSLRVLLWELVPRLEGFTMGVTLMAIPGYAWLWFIDVYCIVAWESVLGAFQGLAGPHFWRQVGPISKRSSDEFCMGSSWSPASDEKSRL